MIGLETAAAYVLGIITENEDFKKFPKEFVGESIKWVKSWFLTPEDPKATAKLIDPDKSIEVKKDIIADKLAELKNNPTFQTELTEKIQLFEHHRRQLLNTIENSDIEVKGNFKQSNSIGTGSSDSDTTNSIKGSKIVVGGDFTQGNDIQQGHTIVNNDFYAPQPSETSEGSPQYKAVKNDLKALLAEGSIRQVIKELLDITEYTDYDKYNTTLLIFAQYSQIRDQSIKGIIKTPTANIELNRLANVLLSVIDDLAD